MERSIIARHFKNAVAHVHRGEILVSGQRKRIAKTGLDPAESRKLLAQFEELQAMHVAYTGDLQQTRWQRLGEN